MTPHADSRCAALRCGRGVAGAPSVRSFAVCGGHPDGGFGLVVADPGNPRSRRRVSRIALAI